MTTFTELEPTLARLDLAELDRWLAATSSRRGLDAMHRLVGDTPDPHRRLAALVVYAPSTKIREAVAVASWGLGGAATTEVAVFLRLAASAVGHQAAMVAGAGAATDLAAESAEPGRLVVADEHEGLLPLLDLAGDVASQHPGGLAVCSGSLSGLLGIASTEADTATVMLDLDAADADAATLAEIFAHEVGHVLDHHRRRRATPDADETFANHLGPALLRANPATVAEAEPLIAAAHAAAGPLLPDDETPATEALAAWFWWWAQPLDDLEPAALQVVAGGRLTRL